MMNQQPLLMQDPMNSQNPMISPPPRQRVAMALHAQHAPNPIGMEQAMQGLQGLREQLQMPQTPDPVMGTGYGASPDPVMGSGYGGMPPNQAASLSYLNPGGQMPMIPPPPSAGLLAPGIKNPMGSSGY